MPWWVWTLLGIVFWFFVGWRPVFREWAKDFSPMDFGDLCMGVLVAIVGSVMGPFMLVGSMDIWRRGGGDSIGRVLAGESRADKRKRRERELQEREARVARLERQLGIGNDAAEGTA